MTDNMKKGIIALGLLASLSAYSQESYVPQAGEGIVYFLPKTKVAIDIIATKVDYQPGDFSLYFGLFRAIPSNAVMDVDTLGAQLRHGSQ